MKRIFNVSVGIVALACACAPNNGALSVKAVVLPDVTMGDCRTLMMANLYTPSATLDLAAGAPPQVSELWRQIVFDVLFRSAGVSAGGTVLEPDNRESFIYRGVRLTYAVKRGTTTKVLPVTDEVLQSAHFNSNSQNNNIIVNILGPKGAAALYDEVPPSATGMATPDEITHATISLQLFGNTSGSNAQVTSDVIDYPVDVWNTRCANGPRVPQIHQCPYPGQDGISACKP